ncbi:MAG TPA: hypothetical protein VII11_00140 [Bacteroidota bacterium]
MTELADDFRFMTELKKARHQQWQKENRRLIDETKIAYEDKGEALLFREQGKPKIDFYPSTGRWKVFGRKGNYTMMRGGAKAFIVWYQRHPLVPVLRH